MTFYTVKSSYYKMKINKSSFDLFLKLVLYFNGVFEISFIFLLHACIINISFIHERSKKFKNAISKVFSMSHIYSLFFTYKKHEQKGEYRENISFCVL